MCGSASAARPGPRPERRRRTSIFSGACVIGNRKREESVTGRVSRVLNEPKYRERDRHGSTLSGPACCGSRARRRDGWLPNPPQQGRRTGNHGRRGEKESRTIFGFHPSGKELKASIHFVDLNGDGIPEALVISDDPQDCGSHGCSAFVLDLRGPAAKDIGDFLAFDLQPLSSRTRGWRDISLIGSRGNHRVSFNGRVYSSAEASPPAAPASGSASGGPVPHHHQQRECVETCRGVQSRFRGQQALQR